MTRIHHSLLLLAGWTFNYLGLGEQNPMGSLNPCYHGYYAPVSTIQHCSGQCQKLANVSWLHYSVCLAIRRTSCFPNSLMDSKQRSSRTMSCSIGPSTCFSPRPPFPRFSTFLLPDQPPRSFTTIYTYSNHRPTSSSIQVDDQ